jgi:hypothetical protein
MRILLLKWSDDIERPETKSFIHHMEPKVLNGRQVSTFFLHTRIELNENMGSIALTKNRHILQAPGIGVYVSNIILGVTPPPSLILQACCHH